LSFTASGTACEMGTGPDLGKLLITSGTGTCSVTAHKGSDANYESADSAAHDVTIHKAAQAAVTVTGPSSVTYGSTGTATASGGSGTGAYSFSHGASTGCSVAGTTVS